MNLANDCHGYPLEEGDWVHDPCRGLQIGFFVGVAEDGIFKIQRLERSRVNNRYVVQWFPKNTERLPDFMQEILRDVYVLRLRGESNP